MADINNVYINRYIVMRKLIPAVILVVFSISLMLLISGVCRKILKEKRVNEKISVLPSFSFKTLANNDFNSSEIKEGPVLIVRFHPECEHCRYEISRIFNSDIPALVSKALLISSDHPDSILKFLEQFKFSDFPAIIALADTSDSFSEIFGKDIVPSNYIYDKKLKLVKVLAGEVKTETIIKYIQLSE
jgi:thiol-disulfide isomerase/thioredoxin